MSNEQENNKIEYREGMIEKRVKMINNPFLDITPEQIKAMQRNLEGVNKIMLTLQNSALQQAIKNIALNSPILELSRTLNSFNNPQWLKNIAAIQKSIQPLRESMLASSKMFENLKPIFNQYQAFAFQNKDLLKGFSGLSISFLLQSQSITRHITTENAINNDKQRQEIVDERQTISQASIRIQSFATKNDIERLEEKINLLEKQNLLPTKEIEQNSNNCEKLTWLSLTHKGLILNDTFLYHTFKPNVRGESSINEKVIRYLINHPNVEFSRDDLIENNVLNKNDDKDFTICLQDMKFENEFAKLFFEASKDKIKLINPITPEIKKERGISYIPMPKVFKRQKKKK
jgi:hypothetical protein